MRRWLLFALLPLVATACATLPPTAAVPDDTDTLSACRALFGQADREVRAASVGDARAQRIDGFPWLRVDRPLTSFRDEVDDDERFAAWIGHLGELDRAARTHELANLPTEARTRLEGHWHPAARTHDLPAAPLSALDTCREALNRALMASAEQRAALRETAVARDDYITWHRVVGAYWIAVQFTRPAITSLHDRLAEVFDTGMTEGEDVAHYAVPRDPLTGTPEAPEPIAAGIRRDALDIPQPDAHERGALFDAHAPIWAVETQSEADLPGALVLAEDDRPVVDNERPAEYRYTGWTRFGDDVLLQLNYLLWFPERPPQGRLDLYAGHLDSVIWRVTLTREGDVLAYDSIHGCGCYYTLIPGPGWQATEPPEGTEQVFSPARAPRPAPGERLVVALDPSTHYIAGLGTAADESLEARMLAPLPADMLRSLPRRGGGSASAFAPDGLIPSSARPERFVFWPFGVPSAGAMRQPGTHAIAFRGRRHFDDARVLEDLLDRAESGE